MSPRKKATLLTTMRMTIARTNDGHMCPSAVSQFKNSIKHVPEPKNFCRFSCFFSPAHSFSLLLELIMATATTKRPTPFYFGGAASCVAAMVVHPFDLTKVRLQNTKGASQSGMFSTMISIAKNEGLLQLYAGLSASLLRQATYSTVRFGVYEKLKQYIISRQDSKYISFCPAVYGARTLFESLSFVCSQSRPYYLAFTVLLEYCRSTWRRLWQPWR